MLTTRSSSWFDLKIAKLNLCGIELDILDFLILLSGKVISQRFQTRFESLYAAFKKKKNCLSAIILYILRLQFYVVQQQTDSKGHSYLINKCESIIVFGNKGYTFQRQTCW